jgi:hypothetical protein
LSNLCFNNRVLIKASLSAIKKPPKRGGYLYGGEHGINSNTSLYLPASRRGCGSKYSRYFVERRVFIKASLSAIKKPPKKRRLFVWRRERPPI